MEYIRFLFIVFMIALVVSFVIILVACKEFNEMDSNNLKKWDSFKDNEKE